jgi:RNA polymerase sigma-70 factor (ECF subfamily)
MTEETKDSGSALKEDAALIRAFQAGNESAFEQLVVKHRDKLFNLCFWVLGDYQEANDSSQETFIKVFRSLKRFRFEAAFTTWLYRIAINTCKNKIRSSEYRKRKKTVSLENQGASGLPDPPLEFQDNAQSPLSRLESKEKFVLIQKAMNTLPPDQQTVITLRDIEGLSYEEIVQITGFNLGTVKSRLARARLDLRNKLRSVI